MVLLFLLLVAFPNCFGKIPSVCENGSQCGSNSICSDALFCECEPGYFSPRGSETDCRSINEPDPACSSFSNNCVFCGNSYTGPCLKCTNMITSSGECVDSCDETFQISVIPNTTLSARVCEGQHDDGFIG
jgi:hypothetical protein